MLVSSFRDGVYVAVDTLRADRREDWRARWSGSESLRPKAKSRRSG